MVDWQITAKTIYCDAVDDEITLIVQKDWSCRCVSADRYAQPDSDTAALLLERGLNLSRQLRCEGPQCGRLLGYLEKLQAEEAQKNKAGFPGMSAAE